MLLKRGSLEHRMPNYTGPGRLTLEDSVLSVRSSQPLPSSNSPHSQQFPKEVIRTAQAVNALASFTAISLPFSQAFGFSNPDALLSTKRISYTNPFAPENIPALVPAVDLDPSKEAGVMAQMSKVAAIMDKVFADAKTPLEVDASNQEAPFQGIDSHPEEI